MRCNKCGTESPDSLRFCPVCGNKLQSDRQPGTGSTDAEDTPGGPDGSSRRLLDFQGWARSGRGSGRYIEACLYAVILVAGVVWCLKTDLTWPLYPLIAGLGLAAWLRRL
jgi:hypothetical protein